MRRRRLTLAALLAIALTPWLAAQTTTSPWWLTEPIRFLQTNLSERDSVVDPVALVSAVDETGADTFLVNMGGIVDAVPDARGVPLPERVAAIRP